MVTSRRDIFERRTPSKKEGVVSRRTHALHRLLLVVCLLLTALIAMALLSRQSRFLVGHIAVEGAQVIDASDVRARVEDELDGAYFGLFPKRNLLLLPKNVILQRLFEAYPRLKSVTITWDWNQNLTLTLSERQIAYTLCQAPNLSEPCFAMDDAGYVFAPAPVFTGAVYLALADERSGSTTLATGPVGTVFASKNTLDALRALKEGIENIYEERDSAAQVLGIIFKPSSDYSFIVGDTIRAPIEVRITEPLSKEPLYNLAVLLDQPDFKKHAARADELLSYIDLRFGKKVYYSFVPRSN